MSHHSRRRERKTAPAKAVRLGHLEAQVMNLLWTGEALTVREIIDRLASEHAYTTIATVLNNLRKKNFVCPRKDGAATLYTACVTREEHATNLMEHALDSSGDRAAAILHFVDSMTDTDLKLLRDHLLGSGED